MSFEYIIEKDNSTLELTKEQEGLLVKNISSNFVSLNSERAKNLEMASSLANEIFFKQFFPLSDLQRSNNIITNSNSNLNPSQSSIQKPLSHNEWLEELKRRRKKGWW